MGQTDVTIYTLESKDVIDYKLTKNGFKLEAFFMSESVYFTTFEKKDIKERKYNELINHSLIVRSFYEDITKTQTSYLVHKHKYFNKFENVLSEELSYTKLDSATKAIYILNATGLFNWVTLQQNKYIYKKGEVTLILSKVNGLDGYFIMVEEFKSMQNLPRNKKFKALCNYVDNLYITHTPDYSCKKSYMLYEIQKRRGKK